ncbi:hypothetical protein Tco_1252136, partial [Tanacetum coccineum]
TCNCSCGPNLSNPLPSEIDGLRYYHSCRPFFREESQRGIPPTSVKTDKPQVSAFVPRQNDNNNSSNNVSYHIGWIIDSRANQHMINSTKDMIDIVDVCDLKLTVGYPNGTLAKITHVGNLRLNNDVILFNVLVVPEYTSEIKAKSYPSPCDDKGGPSHREGGVHELGLDGILGVHIPYLGFDSDIHQPRHDGLNTATPLDDNNESQGNVRTSEHVLIF